MLDSISTLYMQLMQLSGKDNAYNTDYLNKGQEADPNAKEILIGHTNRPETQQVLSQLASNEFAVAVVGNKLVITGIVEALTPYAINYFVNNYLAEGSNGEVAGDLFYKEATDTVVLVDKGNPVYTIVRPQFGYSFLTDMCGQIFDVIYNKTGVEMPVKNDELFAGETHDENALEILVGDVSYDIVDETKRTVLPDEYCIKFVGSKIVIYAWYPEGMEAALDAFKEMLTYGCYTDPDGNTTVCIEKKDIAAVDESVGYYTDVPLDISGVRYNSVYNANDGAMMLYWGNATDAMLNTYAESLVADGYTLHQSLDNNSVHSVTYKKGKASVCAYFLKRLGQLRVVAQDNVAVLPVMPYEYEKICEPCVTQVGSYKLYTTSDYGDMGYIIRLEDGTFVIIDGGNGGGKWDPHVEDVYNKLLELKPAEMDEIVVSAWIITHGHGDHFGVLANFMKKYNDKITVKMLLGNDPSDIACEATDRGARVFDYNSVNGKFGGCVNVKIHTGQQFFFPGATITVLSTQEDVFPDAYSDFNSYAATIFDTVIKDTRFMWLADATQVKGTFLVKMYKEDLKCDVVQLAHHGNGTTVVVEVYQYCDPKKVFWPMGIGDHAHMNRYTYVYATRWVVDHVGWENVYILGNGYYTIWFEEVIETGGLTGGEVTDGDFTNDY
ncbi:MAG: MBL fold metallo-hydrolase [Clostridia bacterium]|nr:MBL fold metallo-hydrolase [Clostridia bacterium]